MSERFGDARDWPGQEGLPAKTHAEHIDPTIHIDPDDPRYEGFRIREYWIATALDPDDQEGPLYVDRVAAYEFHLGVGPAMASDERRLMHLRAFAEYMARTYEVQVRIRHFVPEGEDVVFG